MNQIRVAMLRVEREVMQFIRYTERKGGRYAPLFMSLRWSKALTRLVAKGRVKVVRSRGRFGGSFYKEVK